MSFLLTSVFRPFGVDDDYGRKENKLELFHNQVTREQGIFSMRYNHRSFGLYFIAENIEKPTVVLDFPNLRQFRKEVRKGYEYVGISFIAPNFIKAKKMAEIVREESPDTQIILGGHGTRIPDIEKLIDCDHVFPGEGIHQLRRLFGEDEEAPIKHPIIPSAEHKRILGMPIMSSTGLLIPGVGCPNACRFCCTSHFFDKTYYPYLKTGQELFDTMVRISEALHTDEFFVMDENFLLHKDRAMELLALMEEHNRTFNFSIFSSAEAVTAFGVENMVRLGVSYLWLGVESKKNLFEKTKGVDLKKLIADLRGNGIMVLASSILFLEHHDKETIWEDIDFSISLKPDFSQFMQLGPLPQTKLYLDYKEQGLLREDLPYEEWHGQHQLWFRHPNFTPEESERYLRAAFRKEFESLGPSIMRWAETQINGLTSKIYDMDDPFMRRRYEHLRKRCRAAYYSLTAMKWLMPTRHMKRLAAGILARYRAEFGRRGPLHWLAAPTIYSFASIAKLKLAITGSDAHNPSRIRTSFRMQPEVYRQMEEMKDRVAALIRNRKAWAILDTAQGRPQLTLSFAGRIKERTLRKLMARLDKQQPALETVRVDVTPLASYNEDTFKTFLDKLSEKTKSLKVSTAEVKGRFAAIYKRRKTWAILKETDPAAPELDLHFAGDIKGRTLKSLLKRLRKRVQPELKSVNITLTPMARFNETAFERFMESLSARCRDIRVSCSETRERQVACLERLNSRRICSVSTF